VTVFRRGTRITGWLLLGTSVYQYLLTLAFAMGAYINLYLRWRYHVGFHFVVYTGYRTGRRR
jgi:hypothetical protein